MAGSLGVAVFDGLSVSVLLLLVGAAFVLAHAGVVAWAPAESSREVFDGVVTIAGTVCFAVIALYGHGLGDAALVVGAFASLWFRHAREMMRRLRSRA